MLPPDPGGGLMARFHFHRKHDSSLFFDDEGMQLADLPEAIQEAMLSAREILADAIKSGRGGVPEAFVIADDTGATLHTLSFATVLAELSRRHG